MTEWTKEKREFWERVYCATIQGYYANATYDPDRLHADEVLTKASDVADSAMISWDVLFAEDSQG